MRAEARSEDRLAKQGHGSQPGVGGGIIGSNLALVRNGAGVNIAHFQTTQAGKVSLHSTVSITKEAPATFLSICIQTTRRGLIQFFKGMKKT